MYARKFSTRKFTSRYTLWPLQGWNWRRRHRRRSRRPRNKPTMNDIERDYCNKRLPRLRFQKVFVEIEWANEPWRISQQRDSSGAHEARATRHFQNRNRKLYSGAFYFNPIFPPSPPLPPPFNRIASFPGNFHQAQSGAVFHSIRRRGLLKGVPSLLWNVSGNFYSNTRGTSFQAFLYEMETTIGRLF